MERHFVQELAELKQELLRMSSLAEQSVVQALKALVNRDPALAQQVDAEDNALDLLQVEIDSRCVKLLALFQPTAKDLRFIVMTTKFTTDLERIGDQAVNIARRVIKLCAEPELRPLVLIPRMAELTRSMIHDVLDAFVYENPGLARQIIQRDDEVDALDHEIYAFLTETMIQDSQTITRAANLISIAHNLERIGDHVTNIAEEIVYLYEGQDIRHQHQP
jgi:phosphate transport system protein